MPTIVLDAAIELLGKYQSELRISAIHLNLSATGDIDVSIIPCSDGNAPKVDTDEPTGAQNGTGAQSDSRWTMQDG